MLIYLNGEAVNTHCQTLLELIQSLDLENKRFAVEMNQHIVSKTQLANTPITEHAHIEIIHAVGGG